MNPGVFLPAAGPACFLDPELIHINFEKFNIFPRAYHFIDWLSKRLPDSNKVLFNNLMPGDVLDAAKGEFTYLAKPRVDENNFEQYVLDYAAKYEGFFLDRRSKYTMKNVESILSQLQQELSQKLNNLILHERIKVSLYFQLSDISERILRIGFIDKKIDRVASITDSNYYAISTYSWQTARVMDKRLSWEDISLTFRLKLNRQPDNYQTLIQGFLIMEAEDMNWFCNKLLNIESRGERLVVESQGIKYSVDRYYPHQGADLSEGWINDAGHLVCLRHRWCFELGKNGACLTSNDSIHSIALEND